MSTFVNVNCKSYDKNALRCNHPKMRRRFLDLIPYRKMCTVYEQWSGEECEFQEMHPRPAARPGAMGSATTEEHNADTP